MITLNLQLNSFFIFNSTLGPREGEELKRILYFHPSNVDDDGRKMHVGLCEAVVKFMETFTEEPCEALNTQKNRYIFYQPEREFWMVMVLSVPSAGVPTTDYHPDEIPMSAASNFVKCAYSMFRMFMGPFADIPLEQIYNKCDHFFTPYISTSSDVTSDVMPGVERLPLDRHSFFKLCQLIDDLTIEYPHFRCLAMLCSQTVLWADLSAEDLVTMYKYLVTTLLPEEVEIEMSTGASLAAGRYISPRKGIRKEEDLSNVTKVYLTNEQTGRLETFHLLIYRALSITVCFTVPESTPLDLIQIKSLDALLVSRLSDLASCVGDCQATLSDKSAVVDKPLYCHYNRLSAEVDTNIQSSKLSASVAVKTDVLNIIADVHAQRESLGEFGEIIIKSLDEWWVTGRRCGEREVFVVIQQRNANLKGISDEVKKVCDANLKGIFFYPM